MTDEPKTYKPEDLKPYHAFVSDGDGGILLGTRAPTPAHAALAFRRRIDGDPAQDFEGGLVAEWAIMFEGGVLLPVEEWRQAREEALEVARERRAEIAAAGECAGCEGCECEAPPED